MRRSHFEAIGPICPRCRALGAGEHRLVLTAVDVEDAAGIRFGALQCPNTACWLEFPIIDGAPILVPDVRGWIAANQPFLVERDDMPPRAWSQIGDCAGPDSAINASRQHRSQYGWDHWGDHAAPPSGIPIPSGEDGPGGVARVLESGLALLPARVGADGPCLDMGAACGRATFELAARFERLTLGIDLNWPLTRIARRALERGEVAYPLRRCGVVFDHVGHSVSPARPELVDFWVADAQTPPFADRSWGVIAALNLIDCVGAPVALLHAMNALLIDGGGAVLATPFDWASAATPYEAWLGGHSQRAPDAGDGATVASRLFRGGDHPQAVDRLVAAGEPTSRTWSLRLHDRSTMRYDCWIAGLLT